MEKTSRRRISIITDIILFAIISSIIFMLFNNYYKSDLSYSDDVNKILASDNLILEKREKSNIESENKMYIKNIKEEYGIKIKFGRDIEDFIQKVDAISQYDIYVINSNLKVIYEALEKYPNEVFDMTRTKKYPITIMLVDKFNNDNLALASRNNLNEFSIYISNAKNFERAFHHEMYHLLEYYMSDTKKYLYASWKNFNPENFTYEKDISKLNNDYVYIASNITFPNEESLKKSDENIKNSSVSENEKNPYFVSKYSKVTEKEDRAEIFAELMTMTRKARYLGKEQNIRKKADFMTDTIKRNVTGSDFYYSKFLY